MICNRTNRLLNLFFKLSKKLETETQRKSETEADLVARFCNGIFFVLKFAILNLKYTFYNYEILYLFS